VLNYTVGFRSGRSLSAGRPVSPQDFDYILEFAHVRRKSGSIFEESGAILKSTGAKNQQ
jgi:hypothetical protein